MAPLCRLRARRRSLSWRLLHLCRHRRRCIGCLLQVLEGKGAPNHKACNPHVCRKVRVIAIAGHVSQVAGYPPRTKPVSWLRKLLLVRHWRSLPQIQSRISLETVRIKLSRFPICGLVGCTVYKFVLMRRCIIKAMSLTAGSHLYQLVARHIQLALEWRALRHKRLHVLGELTHVTHAVHVDDHEDGL